MKLSPALIQFATETNCAACPEEVAKAATPPSKAAILFSNTSVVGFINLV